LQLKTVEGNKQVQDVGWTVGRDD